jgi:hypothetical protein
MTAHLHASLHAAARLAIAHENSPGGIIHAEWAKTYSCSVDDVREALNIAANGTRKLPEEIASAVPVIDGEGK